MTKIYRPEGLRGDIKVTEMTEAETEEAHLKLLFHIRQENIRQNRRLYDHSKPVDEYYDSPDPQPAGDFEIQPNYDGVVRIEGILVTVPVGATSAVLKLGRERTIPLYSGAAAAVQTIVNIQGIGMMLSENDRRVLTLAGTMTTGFHAHLNGFRFEFEGNA